VYKVALAQRRAQIAGAQARAQAAAVPVSQSFSQGSAPGVRVVTLPPLVITKTS
jgi:hypothetical protein